MSWKKAFMAFGKTSNAVIASIVTMTTVVKVFVFQTRIKLICCIYFL